MNNLNLLVKMTESDKRVLIAIFIIILLIIIIFGYIEKLVAYIMHNQGLQIDTMMYDIIKTRVITEKREFKKEAYRKSYVYFMKKSWISFIILSAFVAAMLIYGASINDPSCQYIGKAVTDITVGLNWPMGNFFGLNIPINWPTISKAPDFSWSLDKYLALFFLIGMIASGIVYLVQCQALMARSLRVRKLCHTYFAKDINKISTDHA